MPKTTDKEQAGLIQGSRRDILTAGTAITVGLALNQPAFAKTPEAPARATTGNKSMSTITVKDGTQIFFKEWGTGQPIFFHHGWPLSSDDWDNQMMFFSSYGFRVVAHDRRGHGRSSPSAHGADMDTYAADVAAVAAHLDLRNAVHVGHSTGGGEVVRYVSTYGGGDRVAKAVLISAIPPTLLKSWAYPGGLPMEVFDGIRAGVAKGRPDFFRAFSAGPFFGYNRPGAKVSEPVLDNWMRQAMTGDVKAQYDCVKAFSETDFTSDLKKITQPVMVMHGEDDQIVPIETVKLGAKLLKDGVLKTYPGFPHGMPTTNADVINADILAFIRPAFR